MSVALTHNNRAVTENAIVETLTDTNGKAVEIEIRRPDFFVNATRVCATYGTLWYAFSRLPRSKEFIEDLQEIHGVVMDINGPGDNRQSWIHPTLAVELLAWCNRKFRVRAACVIQRYMTGQVTTEESRAVAAQVQSRVVVADMTDSTQPTPPHLTAYQQTRVDSILLHSHLSDTLNNVLEELDLQLINKGMFFAKANDMCNRAVLNLDCTTDSLKRKRGIPKDLSIPAMLSPRQLRDLNTIRAQLVEYIRDDADVLRQISTVSQLDAWFAEKRERLLRGAACWGFHARTVDNLLPVSDARAQAKELVKIRRNHALPPTRATSIVTGEQALRMLAAPPTNRRAIC